MLLHGWRPRSLRLPRMVDQAETRMMANVDVLIPPAVEPEEPPMNMRNTISNKVGVASSAMFTELNPAVRGVTDWNKEVITVPKLLIPERVLLRSVK